MTCLPFVPPRFLFSSGQYSAQFALINQAALGTNGEADFDERLERNLHRRER